MLSFPMGLHSTMLTREWQKQSEYESSDNLDSCLSSSKELKVTATVLVAATTQQSEDRPQAIHPWTNL